jgi:hypothetical protein
MAIALKQRALTPAICQYFFWSMPLESSSYFGKILEEGGAVPLLPCLQGMVSYSKLHVVSVVQ